MADRTPSGDVAFILAAVGLAMAAYLVSVREPKQAIVREQKEINDIKSENGIVTLPSHHSVDQTVEKLKKAASEGGQVVRI
jgi:hypothetical protein